MHEYMSMLFRMSTNSSWTSSKWATLASLFCIVLAKAQSLACMDLSWPGPGLIVVYSWQELWSGRYDEIYVTVFAERSKTCEFLIFVARCCNRKTWSILHPISATNSITALCNTCLLIPCVTAHHGPWLGQFVFQGHCSHPASYCLLPKFSESRS